MKRKFNILVVDDNSDVRGCLERLLATEGYSLYMAASGLEALEKYYMGEINMVISDVVMPGMDGFALFKAVRNKDRDIPFVIITGYSNVDDAVNAMKLGVVDYITKPFNHKQVLAIVKKYYQEYLRKCEQERAEERNIKNGLSGIIGTSRGLKKVIADITAVADTEVPVLITGESGTGKEMVARAIHNLSPRESNPFVPVNCSAVPLDLLENEFFGHEQGAYSGADKRKLGLFEIAHTGTLFLDEIGDMPLSLQAKILRTLDDKKFRRVGGTEEIEVDVRVISATNHDLENDIQHKAFREDLFFRLSGFELHIPPLRERLEDIPLLVQHFLKSDENSGTMIGENILDALMLYSWPGNVRELHHLIERLRLLARGKPVLLKHLPERIRHNYNRHKGNIEVPVESLGSLEDIEKNHIQYVLKANHGDKNKTAKILGIGLTTLYRKLEKYGIKQRVDEYKN